MHTNPTAETPYAYGRRAYQHGLMCIPALDRDFTRHFLTGEVGTHTRILKDWQRGWIVASLSDAAVSA